MKDESSREEILVNVTAREVRAALLENGVLQEVFVERAARRGLIGNLYKGRVSRVLPGMQAAFVDIGLDRTGFLHASDIERPDRGPNRAPDWAQTPFSDEEAETPGMADAKTGPDAASVPDSADSAADAVPDIRELVREGEELLVQVAKDPIGSKGARLTTFITLPSRYLVYLPNGEGVGVSARIDVDAERERLRRLVEGILAEDGQPGGVIIRTAAEGSGAEALGADLRFLRKLWNAVQVQCSKAGVKTLVHEDLPLPMRILRDLVTVDVERIQVDSEADCHKMQSFAATFLPEIESKIRLYARQRPIFDLHGVEDEIARALDRSIPLKSGGHVVFDQTEAMTTVDVNTGGYVGRRNLEETIFRTNLEAAVTIARQLRLRNLGGIIIIDFIDMEVEEHRRRVMQVLEQSMLKDHARHQIMAMSPLGLVELTRKRSRESLQHILCEDCPNCDGRGFVMTSATVCFEIFREIIRQHRQFKFDELLVLAHQDVIEMLLTDESSGLAEMEAQTGKPVRLQPESLYLRDQFDVVLI